MRLLLIEDDTDLCTELTNDLRLRGYAVDASTQGVDGCFMGESEPYDIVILDLGLPDLPGLQILQQWRAQGINTPVLVLTARGAWHEKVEGFRAGADDYLSKPFHMEELCVRLQALIRRSSGSGKAAIEVGHLRLDEDRQVASWTDSVSDVSNIELTGIEFRLLRYMMLHPERIFTATHLIEHVYDFNDEKESNVIEVYISRLRKKLGKAVICTRRSQGYYLDPGALHKD